MTSGSRIELLDSLRSAYESGSWKDKVQILDSIVSATGYNRKYAIRLLTGSQPMPTSKRARKRTYDVQIHAHVKELWLAANRVCSKRLKSLIPVLLPVLESRQYLNITDCERTLLLSLSASTIDRMLKDDRQEFGPRKRNVSYSNALRKQIPICTTWNDPSPGFCEIDLVSHGGQSASGQFLHSLTLTDIATGWTENQALLNRTDEKTLAAIEAIACDFPIPILGLDCDNGGEFINHLLDNYCKKAVIQLTRSREYRKNDQAHVEQKNGAIVRRLVGYDRFEGKKSLTILASLYSVSRLYNNYFQPSFKLKSKVRIGSRVKKIYDLPVTPYQRMLNSCSVSEEMKQTLRQVFQSLDPLELLNTMRNLQNELWQTALADPEAHVREIATPKLTRPKPPPKKNTYVPRPLPHRRPGTKRNIVFERKIWSLLEENPAIGVAETMKILRKHFGADIAHRETVRKKMNEWRDIHPEYAHFYYKTNKRSLASILVGTG